MRRFTPLPHVTLGVLVLLLTLPLAGPARSAIAVARDWVATYDGPVSADDQPVAVKVDASGNVYVTGTSFGGDTNYDYTTVKYNAAGGQVWAVRYNGPTNNVDIARALAIDGSGNVYVTGLSQSNTDLDYATVKYNSAGVEQWVARYNSPANGGDAAQGIVVDGGGSVFVTGASFGGATNYDYATVKYNAAGGEDWVKRYNGPGNGVDQAVALALDGSGNLYVTGSSAGAGTGVDYATVKYNSAGGEVGVARYNGPASSDDVAAALDLDGAGNIYVTGSSVGSGTGIDYATVKYSPVGGEQWVARYNGPGNGSDFATALDVDAAGTVFVTGRSAGIGTSDDYATVRYDASGGQLWASRFGGNSTDGAFSIATDGFGNSFVTGYSPGIGTSIDYVTLRYDGDGGQQWLARNNGPANLEDVAVSLTLDNTGHVYVTGYAIGIGTDYDYATVRYSHPNNPPEVQGDKLVMVTEDDFSVPLDIPAPTDFEGDPFTITVNVVPNAAKGTVRRTGGGAIVAENDVLTPTELAGLRFHVLPNANGSAGLFRYTVSDGQSAPASQTVTLLILPANDAPTAQNDAYSILEEGMLSINAPGVLANDADVDGDAITATLMQTVAHGTLTLFGDGSFLYQPTAGYSGPDSFTYRAQDSANAQSATATVSLTVLSGNDPPVATPQAVTAQGGVPLTITLAATDRESEPITFRITSLPQFGTLYVGSTPITTVPFTLTGSQVIYRSIRDQAADSFQFRGSDGTEEGAPAAVTVTVAAPASLAKVKANGKLPVTGGNAKVALSANRTARKPLKGSLKFTDPVTRQTLKSTRLTALAVQGTTARVFGEGRFSKTGPLLRFMATAEDLGRARNGDRFQLELEDGRVFGPALLTGTVTVTAAPR